MPITPVIQIALTAKSRKMSLVRAVLASSLFISIGANAQGPTTISTVTTVTYQTSTAGNITITPTGEIDLKSGSIIPAITVNSPNAIITISPSNVNAHSSPNAILMESGSDRNGIDVVAGGDNSQIIIGANSSINNMGGGNAISVASGVGGITINNLGSLLSSDVYGIHSAGGVTSLINGSDAIIQGQGAASVLLDTGSVTGGIINNGTIENTGNNGIGIYGTITGSLINNGLIKTTGSGTAIFSDGQIAGGIVNSSTGSIVSTSGYAIDFTGAASSTQITTSGVISGIVQLSAYPDILNIEGGTITGLITGQFVPGQTINISGPFSTDGNISNINTLNVTSTGILGVNNPNTITLSNAGIQLQSVAQFGQIYLNSSYTMLAGHPLSVLLTPVVAINPGDQFQIVTSTGTAITGPITLIQPGVQPNSTTITFTLLGVGTSALTLVASRSNYPSPFESPDIGAVFSSLFPTTSAQVSAFGLQLSETTSVKQVIDLFEQILPIHDGSTFDVSKTLLGDVMDEIADYTHVDDFMRGRRYSLVAVPVPSGDCAYAYPNYRSCPHGGMWIKALGAYADQRAERDLGGYAFNTGGLVVGYDGYYSDHSLIGGALSYGVGHIHAHLPADYTQDIHAYQFTGYLSHHYGPCHAGYVDLMAAVAYDKFTSDRHIDALAPPNTAHGEFNGQHYGVSFETGYHVNRGKTRVTPLMKIKYTVLDVDSYVETGLNDLGLNVKSQDARELVTGAGIKWDFPDRWTCFKRQQIVPELRFIVFYDWLADSQTTIISNFLVGGAPFPTYNIKAEPLTFNLGASLRTALDKQTVVVINGDADLRSNYVAYTASLKLKHEW